MKIGIITFHWGTNYGGVLQSYALQEFLSEMDTNNQVFIINYAPKTHSEYLYKCFATKNVKAVVSNLTTYFKEKNFVPFRKKYLHTTKRYYTLNELQQDPPALDVYICGSDQIWNPYVLNSYGMPYYLSFGDKSVKRISFAASLGTTKYPKEGMAIIKPLIQNFNAVSVRENTGLAIMQHEGFTNACLMPDPTLLLSKRHITKLIADEPVKKHDFVFFYVLQLNQTVIDKVNTYFTAQNDIDVINNKLMKYAFMGIEKWLANIRDAKYVVTNSFHGAVFSILLQKNFVVIPVEGKLEGMNDRIHTLLERFNLKDRILEQYDESALKDIITKPIDWASVTQIQDELREVARLFLKQNINA